MVRLLVGATQLENNIRAYEGDKCITCGNTVRCPLLCAIVTEMAILRYEDIEVRDCGMYVPRQEVLFE